jgi:hypothetical protein
MGAPVAFIGMRIQLPITVQLRVTIHNPIKYVSNQASDKCHIFVYEPPFLVNRASVAVECTFVVPNIAALTALVRPLRSFDVARASQGQLKFASDASARVSPPNA